MTGEQIRRMTERFLSWKLPEHFNPDAGISFTPGNYQPSGTNLFSYTQAEAMVRHMAEALAGPAAEVHSAPSEFSAAQLGTDPILRFFHYSHLPPPMAAVSAPFCQLADRLVREVPRNAERTVALRKLLEAKDCAVRALLP